MGAQASTADVGTGSGHVFLESENNEVSEVANTQKNASRKGNKSKNKVINTVTPATKRTIQLDNIQRRKWQEVPVDDLNKLPTDEIWHLLVEYATSFLPDGIVMRWDSDTVKHIVLDISTGGILEKRLRQKGRIRYHLLQVAAHLEKHPEADVKYDRQVSFPDIPVPYNYAYVLLKLDPNLTALRLSLVPGARIKDDEFWKQYFHILSRNIKKHVLEAAEGKFVKPIIEKKASVTNEENNINKHKTPDEQLSDGWTCSNCKLRNVQTAKQCSLCERAFES